MFRRELLSAAAAAGPLGAGFDQVDFDAIKKEFEDEPKDTGDVIRRFSLVGTGTSKVQYFVPNSYDHDTDEWGDDDPKTIEHKHGAKGDDVAAAISIEHMGELQGWFRGGFHGSNIAVERRYLTPPAKVQGSLELTRTDGKPHSTSTYTILYSGVIDECCSKDNFNFEGVFKSVAATNQFEGTTIKGTITSDTMPGAEQTKLDIKGKQVEGTSGGGGGH